jgi:hypothetical protein
MEGVTGEVQLKLFITALTVPSGPSGVYSVLLLCHSFSQASLAPPTSSATLSEVEVRRASKI